MIDPATIPTGEFTLAEQVVTITRTGTAVTVRRNGRWLGVLTPHGHEGERALRVLEAAAAGRLQAVVRCPTCRTPVTDTDSIRRVQEGTWVCRGDAA